MFHPNWGKWKFVSCKKFSHGWVAEFTVAHCQASALLYKYNSHFGQMYFQIWDKYMVPRFTMAHCQASALHYKYISHFGQIYFQIWDKYMVAEFTVAHCQASALGKHHLMSRACSFIIVTPPPSCTFRSRGIQFIKEKNMVHRIREIWFRESENRVFRIRKTSTDEPSLLIHNCGSDRSSFLH